MLAGDQTKDNYKTFSTSAVAPALDRELDPVAALPATSYKTVRRRAPGLALAHPEIVRPELPPAFDLLVRVSVPLEPGRPEIVLRVGRTGLDNGPREHDLPVGVRQATGLPATVRPVTDRLVPDIFPVMVPDIGAATPVIVGDGQAAATTGGPGRPLAR